MKNEIIPDESAERVQKIRKAHAHPHTLSRNILLWHVECLLAHIALANHAATQPASAPVAEDAVEALALRAITAHFNTFIAACMTEDGKPRAPTTGQLAAARAC